MGSFLNDGRCPVSSRAVQEKATQIIETEVTEDKYFNKLL
jgi:hypothetical protein